MTHPRVTKIVTDTSTSQNVINTVKEIVGNKKVMIILDSDHTKPHVLKEMELYSQFVPIGGYMVVEDTNVNGHPVSRSFGGGPMEALEEYLSKNHNFIIDKTEKNFSLHFSQRGF